MPLFGISLPILLPYLEDTCVPSCIPAYFRYNERESQKNREKIAEMQYSQYSRERRRTPVEPLLKLPVHRPLLYHLAGKFESLTDGWTHASRTLTDYELIVVSSGTVYMHALDKDFTICAGEYLLIPPGERQAGFKPSSPQFYWLHFLCREPGPEEDSPLLELPAFGSLPKPERLIVLMKQMQDCIRTYGDPAENDYLCTGVLCELKNQMHHSQLSIKQDAGKQIYLDIIDYVKYSVNSNLLVRDIAAYFGYNEKYISHVFSRIAGMPLKQYILNQKIEHARALLTDGNNTIAEITDLCGFNDSHTFMRAFKKATGFTPSEYRNTYAARLTNYYYAVSPPKESPDENQEPEAPRPIHPIKNSDF